MSDFNIASLYQQLPGLFKALDQNGEKRKNEAFNRAVKVISRKEFEKRLNLVLADGDAINMEQLKPLLGLRVSNRAYAPNRN